jgi:hypothetical protein
MAILVTYPLLRMIHVFLDNARYHRVRLVRKWLTREDARIPLHFIPTSSPHLRGAIIDIFRHLVVMRRTSHYGS